MNRMAMANKELNMKDGLPREAFAVVGLAGDPDSWKLPHHRKSVLRAVRGKTDIERTVDWALMESAVSALAPVNHRRAIGASPEEVLEAALHLAGHYRAAGKPLPDVLAALV